MLEVGRVQGRWQDGESRPTGQCFTLPSLALAISAHHMLIQPDSSDVDQVTSSMVLGIKVFPYISSCIKIRSARS